MPLTDLYSLSFNCWNEMEVFILAHGYGGFSLWSLGSVVAGLWQNPVLTQVWEAGLQ